eukprot:6474667-Amphidinium_carterae.1
MTRARWIEIDSEGLSLEAGRKWQEVRRFQTKREEGGVVLQKAARAPGAEREQVLALLDVEWEVECEVQLAADAWR